MTQKAIPSPAPAKASAAARNKSAIIETDACMFEVAVEYATGGQTPEPAIHAFSIGGRRVVVTAVIDRWPALDHTYIKLLGDDQVRYILRHDGITGCWQVILFEPLPAS